MESEGTLAFRGGFGRRRRLPMRFSWDVPNRGPMFNIRSDNRRHASREGREAAGHRSGRRGTSMVNWTFESWLRCRLRLRRRSSRSRINLDQFAASWLYKTSPGRSSDIPAP